MIETDEGELRSDEIELIAVQEGWFGLGKGFFCKISRNGLCVEAFGSTRRQALRHARKAWNKESLKRDQRLRGYPRVRDCE